MCKILILVDDESIRLLYEEELTDEGYEIISEDEGSDIGEMVSEKRPDLFVLDLSLGAVRGFDVLKRLRTTPFPMPVILCTAYPVSPKEARAMGADDRDIESSDLSEFKLKIKKALHPNPSSLPLSVPVIL